MDEDTTTGSDSIELGDVTPSQPSDSIEITEPAAQSPEPTTTNETTDTPEAAADENVAWLQNKGIDPSDPEAIAKVAKMYRDAERAMHEARQPKLEDAITDAAQQQIPTNDEGVADPVAELNARLKAVETREAVSNFFSQDGIDAELRPVMSQLVQNNPQLGLLYDNNYLSLEQLYAMAKGSSPNYETNLKQAGGREALEQVATRQQGRAVQGVATTSAVSGDTPSDPFLDGFNSI